MGEEAGRKTSLGLKRTYSWLLRSKRSRRQLPLPALYVLAVPLLSHRTLKLTRSMIKAGLVTSDQRRSDVALYFAVRMRGKSYKSYSNKR
jgi:hypothetical protein